MRWLSHARALALRLSRDRPPSCSIPPKWGEALQQAKAANCRLGRATRLAGSAQASSQLRDCAARNLPLRFEFNSVSNSTMFRIQLCFEFNYVSIMFRPPLASVHLSRARTAPSDARASNLPRVGLIGFSAGLEPLLSPCDCLDLKALLMQPRESPRHCAIVFKT